MNENEIENLLVSMRKNSNMVLLDILTIENRDEWREEALEAARRVLIERGQDPDAVEAESQDEANGVIAAESYDDEEEYEDDEEEYEDDEEEPITPSSGIRNPSYEYHVVPFIGNLKKKYFSSYNAEHLSDQLQKLIDDHVEYGWEFYSLETVDIDAPPGCLGSLFGVKKDTITFDLVVFRSNID